MIEDPAGFLTDNFEKAHGDLIADGGVCIGDGEADVEGDGRPLGGACVGERGERNIRPSAFLAILEDDLCPGENA